MGTKNFYDAVLIGTGLPTLLAGGLLAKRGFRVLLVGQGQPLPSYEIEGAMLPRAPFTLAAHDSPAVSRVFSELALRPLVRRRVRPLTPAFQAVLPRHRLDLGTDPDALTREVEREFPAVRRAVDDFMRATQRSWDSINRLVERDLMWPPTGFFERREHARAALHHPFGKDDAGPHPLADLADDHPFRVVVNHALRFVDGTPLGAGNGPRQLRMFAGLLRGAELMEGGYTGLAELLLDSMRTHNGEVRLADRIDRIGMRRGAVDHVRLSPSDEEVGCHFVLSGLPVSRIGRLLADRTAFDGMLDVLGTPRPAFFRYTLNAVLEREALPEGMARDVLLIGDARGEALGRALRVEAAPLADGQRAVLSAELLVPARASEIEAQVLGSLRERVLDSLDRLSPFLRRHLLWVDSPHDGRGWYDAQKQAYREPPDTFRRGPDTMGVIYQYPRTSLHGVCALPVRTPVKRFFLCSEQVAPGLGQEGTFLAAWSAARAVTKSLGREWMKRGRWTKVEL
jgi:phytoene dehydrogenase-like protein